LLAGLDDSVPVYSADQSVMDGIVGFPLHRGILALGRRAPLPDAADLLSACPAPALVVVLCGIANHDNMGGLFRNAAAFGAHAVLLDAQCCDPLYRKAIRVSVGGSLTVPFARVDPAVDIPDLLAQNGFSAFALSPAGATPLAKVRRPERAALLFGAEGPGLPAALLAGTQTVSIPMASGFDSLNVATTSGIVLYHFTAATTLPA
jgi:tRNA G18 (ribose-2'-O)-methylase SpoU